MSDKTKDAGSPGGLGRRDFLRIGGLAGLAAGTSFTRQATAQSAVKPPDALPVVDVAPLDKIEPGTSIDFTYPDDDSPAILMRLESTAEGGIGPNNSIVAFSTLCTHKGCPVNYKQDRDMLICPCHWSSFDPAKAGRIVIGQASEPLPQITLRISDGKVQATGVSGLIYGRHTNII